MNEPRTTSRATLLGGAVVTLLTFQVGLLWMQGSMLERQHGDMVNLRLDVQDLTEALDSQDSFDGEGGGTAQPSRYRVHARHRALRVRLDEPEHESDKGVRKEMEDQRKSERDAIDKAREARSQLSIEENARKADEKAKIEAETHKYRPLIWIAVGLGLLAMFVRSWLRNRG
jgi:hypothetical protein